MEVEIDKDNIYFAQSQKRATTKQKWGFEVIIGYFFYYL